MSSEESNLSSAATTPTPCSEDSTCDSVIKSSVINSEEDSNSAQILDSPVNCDSNSLLSVVSSKLGSVRSDQFDKIEQEKNKCNPLSECSESGVVASETAENSSEDIDTSCDNKNSSKFPENSTSNSILDTLKSCDSQVDANASLASNKIIENSSVDVEHKNICDNDINKTCNDKNENGTISSSGEGDFPLSDTKTVVKDMVRLIQEPLIKVSESIGNKKGNRVSKRFNSVDGDFTSNNGCFSNNKNHKRVQARSRSTCYDSVATTVDGPITEMVDKTCKRARTRKNDVLFQESDNSTVSNVKCNGEVTTTGLANGINNRIRGRRVSRANSDDSTDVNFCTRPNGLDHNIDSSDKLDINLLLEISVSDRKKFECKKSKIKRRSADWNLIAETEQYYNEKEEIMKNKSKGSESDDSADESEGSDEAISVDSSSVQVNHDKNSNNSKKMHNTKVSKNNTNGKKTDNNTRDLSPNNHNCSNKNVAANNSIRNSIANTRSSSSRNRKTLYDPALLHNEEDDDSFFGFSVATSSANTNTKLSSRGNKRYRTSKKEVVIEDNSSPNKKRLSDAERFLRDNKEYYGFTETRDRLRRSNASDNKVAEESQETLKAQVKKAKIKIEKENNDAETDVNNPSKKCTKSTQDKDKLKGSSSSDVETVPNKPQKPILDRSHHRRITRSCPNNPSFDEKKSFSTTIKIKQEPIEVEPNDDMKEKSDSSNEIKTKIKVEVDSNPKVKEEAIKSEEIIINKNERKITNELHFSFEGIPDKESWFQTYQRFIDDGEAINEFVYDDDPLKFLLPYEMPKEYVKDIFGNKGKGLLKGKKIDLSDLVRKSPRCHASTLALFSDILPTMKKKKKPGRPRITPVKVEETSSDGTSTPGGDSISLRFPLSDTIESPEEFLAIAHCMDHVIKHTLDDDEIPSSLPHCDNQTIASTSETESKKIQLKRGKRKRQCSVTLSTKLTKKENNKTISSNSSNSSISSVPSSNTASANKETIEEESSCNNVNSSSLVLESESLHTTSLCEDSERKDFVLPENILCLESIKILSDSSQCECTERTTCDDLSSVDENTEVSSETVSTCDSETIDNSGGFLHKARRSKKRRTNLTGWPKQKKKKSSVVLPLASDDNDSVLGFDDRETKKKPGKGRPRIVTPLSVESPLATEETDRRASPRKRNSILYSDSWPPRLTRGQK